jgi:hypothetical protein
VRSTEPRLLQEAMRYPDADLWFKATSEEIDADHSNGNWESVQLPEGHRAIGCCWVFKVRWITDGSVKCYKDCLVAKGYSQYPGVDFDETFAPTAKWAALCACCLQAYGKWTILRNKLESTVYEQTKEIHAHSKLTWRAQCMSRLKKYMHTPNSPGEHSV